MSAVNLEHHLDSDRVAVRDCILQTYMACTGRFHLSAGNIKSLSVTSLEVSSIRSRKHISVSSGLLFNPVSSLTCHALYFQVAMVHGYLELFFFSVVCRLVTAQLSVSIVL